MASPIDFFPAQHWLVDYRTSALKADLWAALTTAILVLPQSIAFAAIAGMPVEHGFYTAIVVPVFAALFGASRHMVSGPTTAISALIFTSLGANYVTGSAEYVQAVLTLTLMAGAIQLGLGMLRMGGLASFVSPSVMIGFTTGAAVIIFVSQLPQLLGIEHSQATNTFAAIWDIGQHIREIDVSAAAIGGLALLVAALVMWLAPGWPNYFIALVVATLCTMYIFDSENLRFVDSVPMTLPPLVAPELNLIIIRDLAPAAFAIALVGLLEATAISRSLAIRSNQELDISQEFAGQGISNIVGSFFTAYMGSGSFTRSAANFDAGAQTPLSAVFASLILLIILLLFGRWVETIPVAAVAGIILLVAVRLISFSQIRNVLGTSRGSSLVMVITFALTLLIGLEFAIVVGVFVSLSLYLRRSSMAYLALTAPDPDADLRYFRNARAYNLAECPQLACGRLDGQLYFGSLDDVRRQLRALERERPEQKKLLLLMKHVPDIDMNGALLLIEESKRRLERGGKLYLTMRKRQINDKYRRLGVVRTIGPENVFANKGEAIATIVSDLDQDICANCSKRIFNECPPPLASE